MTNQSDYITIKEASLLTGKWDLTIRRLVTWKKIDYKMINNKYHLNKKDLHDIYPFVEQSNINQNNDSINQNINTKNNIENTNQIINQSIEKHIKPILDSVIYFQEENKKYQKLLSDWEAWNRAKEKEFNKKLEHYKVKIKLLIWLIIILIVIFGLYLLINKGLISINF